MNEGKPVLIPALDENGNQVLKDDGEPLLVQKFDESGNPVFENAAIATDEDGNYIKEQVYDRKGRSATSSL
jgi:hypothetical protein